jgi:simple sugar transport system ATP-binding protein
MLDALDVRSEGPEASMSSLSGGNQQKVVVGRELEPMPAALVAENPTRGLDIRATAAVHERLRAARDAGAAMVVYSSDIDEVIELADRVLVVHAGEVSVVPPVREEIARAMLGAVLA